MNFIYCYEVARFKGQMFSLRLPKCLVLLKKKYAGKLRATASVVWWSEFLATDPEVRVQFTALLEFLRSSGSGTGSTQPREYN
jgi:hypothetical protein